MLFGAYTSVGNSAARFRPNDDCSGNGDFVEPPNRMAGYSYTNTMENAVLFGSRSRCLFDC